jgi:hypothetical protein
VFGLLIAAWCGSGLWYGLTYTFAGQPASGKVIEFRTSSGSSRSRSIVGQVDVTMAGRAPFRAEVGDNLASQDWVVGGEVALRCAEIHVGYLSCSADSNVALLLVPALFMSIGAGLALWATWKLRSR